MDQNRPGKTKSEQMSHEGYSDKSYSPGYPIEGSLGQPRGDKVTVEDVKRGYKPGG